MSFNISEQYDQLYRYCYYHIHDRILAQDIVQETFTRYMERYGSLEEKNAIPYLYVFARNLCIDHYRRKNVLAEKNLEIQPYEEERGHAIAAVSEKHTDLHYARDDVQKSLITKLGVQRALSGLSEEERELLLLISVNEGSVRDAGLILGISRFAVYRRLRTAQKHFREQLGKEGIDGDY